MKKRKNGTVAKTVVAVLLGMMMLFGITGCNSSSSSSYQLHNKDGSLNWEYYNDMQNYFKEHPEKLP